MASAAKRNQSTTGEHVTLASGQTDAYAAARPPVRGYCEAPDRLEAFLAALEKARGTRLLIVIKGHPDPDSIASAIAQRRFAIAHEIEATIVFFDEVSHPENRALVKSLDADLRQY